MASLSVLYWHASIAGVITYCPPDRARLTILIDSYWQQLPLPIATRPCIPTELCVYLCQPWHLYSSGQGNGHVARKRYQNAPIQLAEIHAFGLIVFFNQLIIQLRCSRKPTRNQKESDYPLSLWHRIFVPYAVFFLEIKSPWLFDWFCWLGGVVTWSNTTKNSFSDVLLCAARLLEKTRPHLSALPPIPFSRTVISCNSCY